MSKFYGTVKGMSSTPATRQGSLESGIRASAQSWDGSVVVELSYDVNDVLMVDVCCRDGSQSTIRGESWEGTFDDFRKLLRRSACRRATTR